jgi:hypothetical protein
MNAELTYLMAMSCSLPAGTGIARIKKIEKKYHPFIYMMVLDTILETFYYLAFKFPSMGSFPKLAVNLYLLLNLVLFLYFIYLNNYLPKKWALWLFTSAMLVGMANYFYTGTLFQTLTFLFIHACLINLFVSIDILCRQIMALNEKLFNNFWFWFSSVYILYNALNLIVFGPLFFAPTNTGNGKAIGDIQHFVNVACYLFFAVMIMRIPAKNDAHGPFRQTAVI